MGHGPESAQMLIARAHERTLADHPAGNARRRPGDRSAARAHLRSRPLCAQRLPHPREQGPSARSVVYRAHRHAAGRLGAAHAHLHRRYAGVAARPAHGRAAVPRARHRHRAGQARAERCQGQGPQARGAGGRRAGLREERLQAHPQRPGENARPGRPGAAAGGGTRAGAFDGPPA